MGVPQVSVQALLNEAERHKTWESLEATLMALLERGQVLEYKHEGTHIMVSLNGVNQPVRIPVRAPAPPKAEVPASSFTEDKPETPEPPKPAKKAAKPAKAAVAAPVGVVALVGLKTESYDHHLRRLLKHVLYEHGVHQRDLDAETEKTMQGWFRSLK